VHSAHPHEPSKSSWREAVSDTDRLPPAVDVCGPSAKSPAPTRGVAGQSLPERGDGREGRHRGQTFDCPPIAGPEGLRGACPGEIEYDIIPGGLLTGSSGATAPEPVKGFA